ncbi:MAG TPA: hypothetical protein VK203_02615 [Nostocaceae cyanobacterium]|nr:hypothetical protein [Nostocaceae cyanobacterium]
MTLTYPNQPIETYTRRFNQVIMITYDLKTPGQNYQGLDEAIKSLGNYWHYLGSTWLVDTTHTTKQVRDYLKQFIDYNDRLLVTKVDPSDVSGWLPEKAWNWIYKRRRRVANILR